MKKVILTGMALMAFAAASFAQNVSTVNQNGNSQTGNATQSGNLLTSGIQQTSTGAVTNSGNFARTNQGVQPILFPSINNEAFINQIGSKAGVATIGQEGGSGGANSATINQKNNTGGNATAVFTAAEAAYVPANPAANTPVNTAGAAAVRAAGGNYANAYQEGGKETVVINQNNESAGNYADSRQDNYNNASSSQQVTIDQNNTSTNNTATANQFGDNNKLEISQSRNSAGNTADVRQGFSGAVGGPNTSGATATVEQNGILAGSASTDNTATILQRGTTANTTTATINQNAGADGRSESNTADITQTGGEKGTATISQNNLSYSNKATVAQSSASLGSDATVKQNDFAHDNTVLVNQSGTGGHTANVTQAGTPGSSLSSDNNKAEVRQTGSTNAATVDQLGKDINSGGQGRSYFNKSFVTQSGANNRSFVEQNDYSYNNLSTITQAGGGAGDLATTKQNTNSFNNTATVAQGSLSTGGNTASILQQQTFDEGGLLGNTASIKQNVTVAGGLNTADIIQGKLTNSGIGSGAGQYSNANQATMDQEGSSNKARLRQEGDLNITSVLQNGNNNVLQSASGVAGSFASQTGVGNTLMLTQNSPGSGLAGNTANVTQAGIGNASTVMQSLIP